MHPSLSDYGSTVPIDYESLRNEIVTGTDYVPSFGMKLQLEQQFDMLEKEFAGQLRLKLVHAELIVLLRRGIAPEAAYAHFERLWAEHGDILLETLDSRWLISACDTICDYSADPADAQVAILLSLFANTLKLVETERFMSVSSVSDPERVMKRIPLFDGLTAFMVGKGDMVKNLLRRLDVTLRDDTSVGMIGRELIGRSLSSNTVFDRLAQFQHHNHWQTDLTPTPKPKRRIVEPIISDPEGHGPGYILLNDTARLSGNYHLGTVYACKNLRQNLASRGLREIGWANDRDRWENLMSKSEQAPDLVVLNGEGTLHHGAPRAEELLLLCQDAKARGIPVAVLNTVWEANTLSMQEALSHADLVYVRDSLSRDALPTHFAAKTTPDMSIPMFRKVGREGKFPEPQYDIAVMDCVVPASAETLLRFAEEEKLPYFVMPGHRLHVVREAIAERSGKIRPRLLQITDVMNARGWVTGRFHGLIAALSAGIPVCALPSNTSKIEGLLNDAGLGEICLLSQDWSSETNQRKRDEVERRFEMQKSPEFVQRREAYLEMAVREIDEMFATASALAI